MVPDFSAVGVGWWWAIALVIGSSLIGAVYLWRVVESAWLHPAHPDLPRDLSEAPYSLLIPTWVLVGLNFYFGLDTRLTVGMASQAAALVGGGS